MATTNPICGRCGLEMQVAGIGWLAVYMAFDPPAPYEIRRGDLCDCIQCKARILTKFAEGSPMGHFLGEPFEKEIAGALQTGKLVVVWEHYRDRAKIHGPIDKYLWDWLESRVLAREERMPPPSRRTG